MSAKDADSDLVKASWALREKDFENKLKRHMAESKIMVPTIDFMEKYPELKFLAALGKLKFLR